MERIHLPLIRIISKEPVLLSLPAVRLELGDGPKNAFHIRTINAIYTLCCRLADENNVKNPHRTLKKCGTLAEVIKLGERWNKRYNHKLNQQLALLASYEDAIRVLDRREREYREQERQKQELRAARRQRRRRGDGARARMARQEREKIKQEVKPDAPFPPPPIPGNKFIQPIESESGLKDEGRAMGNCVAEEPDYLRRILKGASYIYRVYYPERCTLEVSISRTGLFGIKEIKGINNCRVPKQTREFVRDWLNRHSPAKKLETNQIKKVDLKERQNQGWLYLWEPSQEAPTESVPTKTDERARSAQTENID